ncbi:MAG: DegV family protein [Thermovirgaceae bacterium]
MKIRVLDGHRLHTGFVVGARALERRKEKLNRMNLFPVPDGDTGSNLAATMGHVSADSEVFRSLSKTSASMADAALMGARGNSGLIFAQFLYGFAREAGNIDVIDAKHFGAVVSRAVPYAVEALNKPVEGTMISVMRRWAGSFRTLALESGDFAVALPGSLDEAKKALEATKNQLPVLREAGVVDAGAQGFVDFLEGINSFLETGDRRAIPDDVGPVGRWFRDEHSGFEETAERYCTEGLITECRLGLRKMRELLSGLGSSLIVGGHQGKVRFHIHTDDPPEVFHNLGTAGVVRQHKAEDMLRQVEMRKRRRSKTAIVTDSTCDLPQEILDHHQVHMIPLRVAFGERVFLDRLTITPKQFYSLQETGEARPVSSQAGVGEFERLYRELMEYYDSVIAIHISGELSGMWNASRTAASRVSDRITVIDSLTASAPLGLLVLEAAEALDRGVPAGDVIDMLERLTQKTKILVSLRTVREMVRGGRLKRASGLLARVLNLKPIVTVDTRGRAVPAGRAMGWEANLGKVLRQVKTIGKEGSVTRYAVVHAHAPETANRLAERLERVLGKRPDFVSEISPVLGIHSGRGSVAVGLISP